MKRRREEEEKKKKDSDDEPKDMCDSKSPKKDSKAKATPPGPQLFRS